MQLTIPSPEQLGIVGALHTGNVDWSTARNRLERLGAVCFNLEKVTDCGFRFTCLLATTNANRNHRVEALAATEADAVLLVLEKSEQWAGGR